MTCYVLQNAKEERSYDYAFPVDEKYCLSDGVENGEFRKQKVKCYSSALCKNWDSQSISVKAWDKQNFWDHLLSFGAVGLTASPIGQKDSRPKLSY